MTFAIIAVLLIGWLCAAYYSGPIAVGIGWVCKILLVLAIINCIRNWRRGCKIQKARNEEKQWRCEKIKRRQAEEEKAREDYQQNPERIFLKKLVQRNPIRKEDRRMYSDDDYRCPICGASVYRGIIIQRGMTAEIEENPLCDTCYQEYCTARFRCNLPSGVKELSLRFWTRQMMVMVDFESGIIDAKTKDAELERVAEFERAALKEESTVEQQRAAEELYRQQQRNVISAATNRLLSR